MFLSQLLAKDSVELQWSKEFGQGLFAKKAFHFAETILTEVPVVSFPNDMLFHAQSRKKSKSRKKSDHIPLLVGSKVPLEWVPDAYMVAQMVGGIIDIHKHGSDLKWKTSSKVHYHKHGSDLKWKTSSNVPFSDRFIPFRCLGYTSMDGTDADFVKGHLFQVITQAYGPSLTACPIWNPEECLRLYDKLKTNAFSDHFGMSLYTICSMFNHSCVPNVIFHPLNPHRLVAARTISAGEQLLISYNVSHANDLPELYGFTCHCEKCQAATASSSWW